MANNFSGRKPQMSIPRWGGDVPTATQPTKPEPKDTPATTGNDWIKAGTTSGGADGINYNVGPIAEQPKVDTDAQFNKAQDMSTEQYTPAKQSDDLTLADKLAQQAASAYMTNERKKAVDPYFSTNQAWQDKYGNLNKKTYDATLAMSRLGDTLNNELRLVPGKAGTTAASRSINTVQKYEPIDTQEMRQMRSNEAAADLARQESIKLQSDTQRMSYDAQQRAMQSTANVAQLIGTSEVELNRAWQNAIMQNEYNAASATYWNQVINKYLEQLRVHMAGKKADIVAALEHYAPALAAVIAPMFSAGVVDIDAWTEFAFRQEFKNEIIKSEAYAKASDADKIAMLSIPTDIWDRAVLAKKMALYGDFFTGKVTNPR